ncbi:hydantoinase/oxoprolinase family protein [Sphingosinicella rhizophila]|uniref:Hydantoinase/oxoprolinase family protein n=1 Tax=Sphingosinicella rhizophila TaxID=3050082 RepID=A0ABU3Q9V6_9SPHN|nr:hydantoinase/oxoprolinase family protein [Sphingosinicella sp. GR2756]MDT9600077.1 hydantoinase/oxoprolinase family protein [Sphingosinicella sp. GR2756]
MSETACRIGIDVGGTNTDAVLMKGRDVIATAKSFTTADVRTGVVNAVTMILDQAPDHRGAVSAVMIGTTQFVNAFVQRRGLSPVAIVRVSLPKANGVPPLAGWPDDLADTIGGHIYMIGGGSHYHGKDYAPLDEQAVRAAAIDAGAKGLRAFAVTSTFAPIRPDLEEKAAAIIREIVPDARITLSARVGGLGLIDRENAAIINASLADMARDVIASLKAAFQSLGILAPIYISQNDGTLISTEVAADFPILTCSAGPTNSIRGAAFLTGLDEAVVADIGGTTTDIGFLKNGFPRETTAANYIGGVRTNFRMPDVMSIGVGGGSLVRQSGDGWRTGPESVGFRLREEARIFGGATLTASDIAVRAGQADIGDPSLVADLPDAVVEAALADIHEQIAETIDQIKTSDHPLPLVLVGGGSILVSREIRGTSQVLRPDHAEVANAVGAAIALVSGRVDKLYDVVALGRDAAIDLAKSEAVAAAVEAGAVPGETDIVEIIELPMTHMQSGGTQIRVRAVGPLAGIS